MNTTPFMRDEPTLVAAVQAQRKFEQEKAAIEAKLDEWGEDLYEDGAVLSMGVRFVEGGPEYSYVFLRAAGRWYGTAALGRGNSATWGEVVAFAVSREITPSDTYEVTNWKRIS